MGKHDKALRMDWSEDESRTAVFGSERHTALAKENEKLKKDLKVARAEIERLQTALINAVTNLGW